MQKPRIKLPAAQWRRREALLPGKPTAPGRPGFNHRKTVAGILGIARAGAPGRARPPYFGQGNAIHQGFRRWVKSGVLTRLLNARQEALALPSVRVDGPFGKVHQPGASPKKVGRPPAASRQGQAIGRSRGGRNTKLLVLTDRQGQMVPFLSRPGNVATGKERPPLLAGVPLNETRELLGDKA